jgi:hypothetical protein
MNATLKPRMNRWAVASLLLGAGLCLAAPRALALTSEVIFFIYLTLGIVAIVSGHLALSRRGTSACTTFSRIMALVGLVLGYVGVGFFVLVFLGLYFHQFGTNCGDGMLSNGRQIFIASSSRIIDSDKKEGWPSGARFTTSTAFFTNLVSGTAALKVNYAFFAARGLKPYTGTNAALFTAENNAWCVVADLGDTTPDSVLFLFTRNVCANSLADLRGRVGETLLNEPPYWKKGAVVVFKCGVAQMLKPDMLWSNILGGQTFTNRVLRP